VARRGRFAETAIGYVHIVVCELRLASGQASHVSGVASSFAGGKPRRKVIAPHRVPQRADGREAEFSSRRQFLRAPPQEGMGRAESRASDRICII